MKLIEHHRPSLCPEFCCQVRWLPDEATDCCMAEHHVQIGSWREDDEPGNRVTTRFAIRIQIRSCETWMPNSVPFQPILDAYSPRSCGRPFTLLRRRHFGISWLVFKRLSIRCQERDQTPIRYHFRLQKFCKIAHPKFPSGWKLCHKICDLDSSTTSEAIPIIRGTTAAVVGRSFVMHARHCEAAR